MNRSKFYRPRKQVLTRAEREELVGRKLGFDLFNVSEKRQELYDLAEQDVYQTKVEELFNGKKEGVDGSLIGDISTSCIEDMISAGIKTRRDGGWWIGGFKFSYNFTGQRGGNYGYHWTNRTLYEYLCANYNNGEYFMDKYFERFEERPVYSRVMKLWQDAIDDLLERRKRQGERLRNKKGMYVSKADWASPELDARAADLAREIKDDAIVAIGEGNILSVKGISETTQKVRQKLGITNMQRFIATGQFVKGLNVFVEADNDAALAEVESYAETNYERDEIPF